MGGGMLLMGRGADLLQGCYKANTVMITILLQTCFADFVTFLLYHLITYI